MEIIKKINKEITFNHNISEITSICMDIDYEHEEANLVGKLNLEGDYISSEEISMSEDFKYKIDFNFPIEERIEPESLKVTIDDFTYDIDQNRLIINVELKINYEEALSEERVEFDKFINTQEVDIQDFLDTIKIPEEQKEENFEKFKEEIKEEPISTMNDVENSEIKNNSTDIEKNSDSVHIEKSDDSINIENSIINITNEIDDNDEYITYHIYIVNDTDTLETIANRYQINADIIKEYNEVENIKSGMKLVIPCDNE